MPNPEEVPSLPDFLNQSALETKGEWHETLKDQFKDDDDEYGDDGGKILPLLEYNHWRLFCCDVMRDSRWFHGGCWPDRDAPEGTEDTAPPTCS